jgi:hypothetical protein
MYYAPRFSASESITAHKSLFYSRLQGTSAIILIYINQRHFEHNVSFTAQAIRLLRASIVKAEPAPSIDRAESAVPRDPQSTEDAISLFSDPDYCMRYLTYLRWPDGQVK